MKYALTPPAGQKWTPSRADSKRLPLEQIYCGRFVFLINSGGSALRLALRQLLSERPDANEVILPAYTCPSVLGAVVAEGLIPLVADTQRDHPWMAVDEVERLLHESTLAVIAPHLCGVRYPLGELARILPPHVSLIEDSAQVIGETFHSMVLPRMTILSFGRGKPVNLLGGGALVCRHRKDAEAIADTLAQAGEAVPKDFPGLDWRGSVYNLVRRPEIFGVISRLPGLGVGRTRYSEPGEPQRMDLERATRLPEVLHKAFAGGASNLRPWWPENEEMATDIQEIRSTAPKSDVPVRGVFLSEHAAERVQTLREMGIGATRMYERIIVDCEGVPAAVSPGLLPNARRLASQLFTLPRVPELGARQIEQARNYLSFPLATAPVARAA